MPTGTAMHYVSGSGNDHVDLPRGDDVGYRRPHTQHEAKRGGLDWDAIAPTCKGCGGHSATVNFTTGLCKVCDPPATKPPKEEKQGKPTTRPSAPRARSTSSTTGRAPVAGPSTTEKEDPAAAQETRPAAAAGPSADTPRIAPIHPVSAPTDTDAELGRELTRAAQLLTASHRHPSPAVAAVRARVLDVLEALDVLLDATRDRPDTTPTETPSQPEVLVTPRAARSPRRTTRGKQVDEQAIVREYVEDRDSTPVIAARHDIWPARVRRILDEHQVERRDDRSTLSGGRNAKTIEDYPAALVDQIRRLYVDEQKTTVQVAELTGHTPKLISAILQRAGIPRRPAANVAGRKGRDLKLNDTQREEIVRRYTAGESSVMLGAAFDVSSPTILTLLRSRGTTIRTKGEARMNHLGRDGAVVLKDTIRSTGATPAQIKVWALREGLIPEIVVGLPPMRVVQAYAVAHPALNPQETTP